MLTLRWRSSTGSRTFRLVLVAVVGLVLLVASASTASAHVDFLGSSPANVSTVDGPISQITFNYSGAADPIADEFSVQSADGRALAIESVESDGADTVVLTTTEPLPPGRIKAAWALRGADGHKMAGSISFTVAAAAGSTTVAPVPSESTSATVPSTSVVAAAPSADESATVAQSTDGVDAILAVAARWLVYGSILFIVGALAYLVLVHRGTRAEGRRLVFFIRRAAVLVVFGSLLEWAAQLMDHGDGSPIDLVSSSAWGSLLSSSFAIGTALRLVGAVLVLRFVAIDVVDEDAIDAASIDDLERLLDPTIGASGAAVATRTRDTRVRVESGPLAILGAALLVVSESFIGHAASIQPRVLVVVSDIVHLTATGIWVAGAWLLTATLWRRYRRNQPLDAHVLAARFSDVATWALIAVTVTGLVLSWAILREPGRLWETEFGRLLLLKVFLVAIIGGLGLHHRRVLVPEVVAGVPDAPDRLRRTLLIESGLFVAVLFVTSMLVAAAPI